MKLLILYNKNSGRNKLLKKLDYIKGKLKERYSLIDVIYDDLEKHINNNYDTLLIIGGDGTINHAINIIAKLNIKINLAFIPNGTCNDYSKSLGYKGLKKSLDIILNNKIIKKDIYKINDKYFLYGFSVGGISHIANNTKKPLGKFSYYLRGIKSIFKKPANNKFVIKYNNQIIEDEFYQIILLNTKYVGGLKTKHKDKLLTLLAIRRRNRINGFFKFINYVLFNSKNKKDIYTNISNLNIKTLEKVEATIDGEYLLDNEFNIEIIMNYLNVIVK